MDQDFPRVGITFLDGAFAVHRFDAADPVPDPRTIDGICACFRTPETTTLVCDEAVAVHASESTRGWTAMVVDGPLDFALTGILAGISEVLARAGISIFALSCWETDYVLVRSEARDDAAAALRDAGYPVTRADGEG
ncbi:ACT domain-containing protein [Elongatibacter sediminis]|uniref:ACT domain-containing protein n=1 Tax=Elongatibacter sediminis TaxID=3119006 RepID=A0AAW9RGY5_9GAMM